MALVDVRQLRNVSLVLLAVAAGVAYPEGARVVEPLTLLLVTFLVYTSMDGVSVQATEWRSYARPVLGVLGLSYVVVPVVGTVLGRLLLPAGSLLGVTAMLAAPATAGSAIVWTRVADGNDELSGLSAITSISVAPFAMPALLVALTGHTLSVPVTRLTANLLVITVGAAVLVAVVPAGTLGETTVTASSMLAIGLLIYAGVGGIGVGTVSVALLGRVTALVLAVFVVGFLGSYLYTRAIRGPREDFLATFFTSTLKNLGVTLLVVFSVGSELAIFAVIAYYVGQQVLSALLVDLLFD